MTEKVKSAIEELERARDTIGTSFISLPKGVSMTLAIRSLKTWEEVLQELEEQIEFDNKLGQTEVVIGLRIAIGIINQHLEIDE